MPRYFAFVIAGASLAYSIAVALPAHAFWDSIFGYGSYEECVLDKMQGVTGDLAAKQIARACMEITKESNPSNSPEQTPTRIERVYISSIGSEWVDGIMGRGTNFRVLVKNETKFTFRELGIWAKMEPCSSNTNVNRTAQSKLKELGYKIGKIDGVIGPATKAAIKKFQEDRKILSSGELDETTKSALGISDVVEEFPPLGRGFLVGTYTLSPGQTAYVDFLNFYAQSRGREFCFRIGSDVKIPIE